MKAIQTIFEDTTMLVFMLMVMGHLIAPFIMLSRCDTIPWPEVLSLFNFIR